MIKSNNRPYKTSCIIVLEIVSVVFAYSYVSVGPDVRKNRPRIDIISTNDNIPTASHRPKFFLIAIPITEMIGKTTNTTNISMANIAKASVAGTLTTTSRSGVTKNTKAIRESRICAIQTLGGRFECLI